MLFKVSGHEVKVEVEKKETFLSKHSDNQLNRFKIHFQVYNPLQIPKTVTSLDDGKKWKVIDSYHYYTEGNPVVRYIFHLEEIENLEISTLHLNKLEIKPQFYQEKVKDAQDILIIKTRFNLDEKQWDYLTGLYRKGFLEVKRDGISSKPKKMRFDKLIWSKNNNNQIKCALSMIEDKFNNYKQFPGFKVEIDNLEKLSSSNNNGLEALLAILMDKKIINDQDLNEIKKSGESPVDDLLFLEVEDLDEFMKKYEL